MAVKCEQLIYTPVNALTFRITGGTRCIKEHRVDNKILSLEASKKIIFETGEIVQIKHFKYRIKYIERKYRKGVLYYELSMAKRTKSSIFIMPMLGGGRKLFFWNKLFLNCFIKIEDDKYCIALLYRWSGDPLFLKFERALAQFRDFKKVYDPTDNTIIFVFDIPQDYFLDFQHFINGKYSKLSGQYKIDILRFHNQPLEGEIGQVLYQDPHRKEELERLLDSPLNEDTELLSIINIEEETFKINDYV